MLWSRRAPFELLRCAQMTVALTLAGRLDFNPLTDSLKAGVAVLFLRRGVPMACVCADERREGFQVRTTERGRAAEGWIRSVCARPPVGARLVTLTLAPGTAALTRSRSPRRMVQS